MSKYNKALTALVTGLIGWGLAVVASTEEQVTSAEWLTLGIAVATAAGVYQVPNRPGGGERGAVEPGSLALGLILGVLLAYLLWAR